jgi:hypothetical protein
LPLSTGSSTNAIRHPVALPAWPPVQDQQLIPTAVPNIVKLLTGGTMQAANCDELSMTGTGGGTSTRARIARGKRVHILNGRRWIA